MAVVIPAAAEVGHLVMSLYGRLALYGLSRIVGDILEATASPASLLEL